MDKRDLEKIIKDADWKKLHSVLHNESEAHVRSTAGRIVDILAEMRLGNYKHGKQKYGGLISNSSEVYMLLLFQGGEYQESICIAKTYHLKRYIQQIAPMITESELDNIQQELLRCGKWNNSDLELRLEHHQAYSA